MPKDLKCANENNPDKNIYSDTEIFSIASDPSFAGWKFGNPTYSCDPYKKGGALSHD